MCHPVTVGVDGSPQSLAAAAWAAEEAHRRHAPLRLVHAGRRAPRAAAPDQGQALGLLHAAAAAAEARHPGLDLREEERRGPPVGVLLEEAGDAVLLVLGSRGAGRTIGRLGRSAGLSVAGRASVPVVLVGDQQRPEERHGPEVVVVGLDPRHSCGEVLDFAFEAARVRSAGVRVVHAVAASSPYLVAPGESVGVSGPGRAESHRGALRDLTRTWRERNPGVPVDLVVNAGSPAGSLVESARDASLCVIGRRSRPHHVGARLGAVDHGVVRHAPCPVAVVPHA